MTAEPDVLLVEDEDAYVEALSVGLANEKFRVRVARAGGAAIEMFDASHPDLVLLDIMLPDMSGIDVCRTLRRRSDVPIIIVSAKSSEVDTVVGLEMGADDYVAKPFRLRELVARMRAALRRSPQEGNGTSTARLVSKELELDRERREVTLHGMELRLPRKEFELLELLMCHAGKVVSRTTIIDRVWGVGHVPHSKTLDVHVKRLRARLEVDPSSPKRIITTRGVGYRFEADPPS